MTPLSVITYKYFKPGYRTVYKSCHVNALAREALYPEPENACYHAWTIK